MDSRFIQVLDICLPVFALMGIGKALQLRKVIQSDQRHFINRLVFNYSLPALVFRGVARQEVNTLLNPGLFLGAFLPTILIVAVFLIASRLLGYRGNYAAAFVFGSFWANVSYMGFPLSRNAFGEAGFAAASVYNAVAMPVFIVLGFGLIGFLGDSKRSLAGVLRRGIINPIVLAAVFGVAFAFGAGAFRQAEPAAALPALLLFALRLADKVLVLLGSMGLPLALLSVGAALRFSHVRGHALPLTLIAVGKLLLVPLFSLLTFRVLLPVLGLTTDPTVLGTTVLLSATPNAVASYVVACENGVEEGFVSTMLVLTTSLSVVTIPFWLYLVL